jgi:hypothetical protein
MTPPPPSLYHMGRVPVCGNMVLSVTDMTSHAPLFRIVLSLGPLVLHSPLIKLYSRHGRVQGQDSIPGLVNICWAFFR